MQNNLKIKDLMVGDYVHSRLHDVDTFIIDVEGRVPKEMSEHEYTEAVSVWLDSKECWGRNYIDEIEPIPLTEELLRKFFPTTDDGVTWYPYNGMIDGYRWFYIEAIGDGVGGARILGMFRYVHELQHILRLCNIDIEIRL